MLQIRNAGSGKSEWNVSETHLIIPMIDGELISNKDRDKILTSAVTLNPLEGSDQTILTNALEHSLVVGLDKNIFETTNYKSDLLIIQNSDLKLLQCNTDIKVAHTLSDVEQDKNEILWQNPILKDRIYGSEKAILEVKQILNYDDVDLEKTSRQITLGDICSGKPSQVIKADKEVTGVTTNQEKHITDSSFVISFNAEIDKSKSICISLNPEVSKTAENVKLAGKKNPLQGEMHSELNNVGPPYKLGEDFEESIFNTTNQMISYNGPPPVSLVDYSQKETDKKDKVISRKNQITEDSNVQGDKWSDGINDSFWEKNLPLKKKAKMKRTLMAVSFENQKALLKDNVSATHEHEKVSTRRNTKEITISLQESETETENDSELPKIKISKAKKIKLKGINKNPLTKEVKGDLTKADSSFGEDEMTTTKTKAPEFVITKFNNIYELVEYLLKCRMINTTVQHTLNSGLKEIKVDILREMIMKKKEHCPPENSKYSPQLKAFALVLYFKQPAAFNHLSQMYRNGWPSLQVIKEWKRRMNTHRRRNFIRAQSDPEPKS